MSPLANTFLHTKIKVQLLEGRSRLGHLSSQYCGSINIRKKKIKHFKAVNQRHSSDEETARQTKCFTKVSTTVLLPLLGEEKALLTSDAFKKVSLEVLHMQVSRSR